MADGHLSFCKQCVIDRVLRHRQNHLDEVREYDRNRPDTPERRAHMRHMGAQHKARHPKANAAHLKVGRARHDGRLTAPLVCSYCGADRRLIAHHESYDQPLNVVWLCQPCHVQLHVAKRKLLALAGGGQ
jgi:hypothetical protein